jgi:hypothetical protein
METIFEPDSIRARSTSRLFLSMNVSSVSRHVPVQARSEQRLKAILEAARLVFSEVGYVSATLTEIARKRRRVRGEDLHVLRQQARSLRSRARQLIRRDHQSG